VCSFDWEIQGTLITYIKTSTELWEKLQAAGELEYDRFWRMPLVEEDLLQITNTNADLKNVCKLALGKNWFFVFLKFIFRREVFLRVVLPLLCF
jgi:leucyl aminopeptidase